MIFLKKNHGNMIFPPNVLERWLFQKKTHWNMVHLVLSGKMVFLSPENMILFFRCKMKDHLSQKNFMEHFFKEAPPTPRATNILNILHKVISLPSLLAEKTL